MITGCALLCAIPRFVAKLESIDGHRLWAGARTRGSAGFYTRKKRHKGKPRKNASPFYGKFWVGPGQKDTVNAHVFAAWLKGLIPVPRVPAGMHIAHSCEHGSLCMDCLRLVPAAVNLEEARTAPIRAVHRPPPSKLKRRGKRSTAKRVTRKHSPVAKKQVDLAGKRRTV